MKDFEIEILKCLRNISSPFLDYIFRIISFLGEQYVLIILICVIYFLIDKKKGQAIAYTILTSACFNNTIKGLVKYERPFVYDKDLNPAKVALDGATGYSFPSGHTQNASTSYFAIAKNFNKKKLFIIATILTILIGFSRLYLGVHYPKDVIFGALFGIGFAFACSYLHDKFSKDFKSQVILYLITILVFFPFLFVFWKTDYDKLLLFRDFYITYSMFLGYVVAVVLEHRCVNFNTSNNLKTNIIRTIGAIITLLITYFGLKIIFSLNIFPQKGNVNKIVFDCIRYFLVPITTFALYPIMFKKKLFK